MSPSNNLFRCINPSTLHNLFPSPTSFPRCSRSSIAAGAIMVTIVCRASDSPDAVWEYCPSFVAAVLFATLFGLTTSIHIIQAIVYRKPFSMVLIMGALWETGGYIARIFAVQNQLSSGIYTVQQLLILLAPLWINAYIYMLLGRMIHFFLVDDRVFKIKARLITRMFVIFDITAFLIQATGGMMTGPGVSSEVVQTGLNIYTAGVGVQLFFLVVFAALAVGFQRKLKMQRAASSSRSPFLDEEAQSHSHFRIESPTQVPDLNLAIPLLRLLYIVLALIIIRNIYRLVEFGTGANSPTVKHEWYNYVFDAVPMFFALVLLNVVHPGKTLQGPRSDFSEEDREMKRIKQGKKAAKKAEKKEKREKKKMAKEGNVAGYESLK